MKQSDAVGEGVVQGRSAPRDDLLQRVREERRARARRYVQQPAAGPSPAARATGGAGVRRRLGGRPSREPLPPLAVVLLNRLAYGPRPGDLEAFLDSGPDDATRWRRHVEAQLHPANLADDDCDARLAAAGFTTLGKSRAQLWQDHHLGNPEWWVRVRPLLEVERATFLRAV